MSGSLTLRLAKTLLCYRTTPHSTTGVTPAEMMLGRTPKIRLDLVKPSLVRDVEISKAQMKFKFDSSARDKQFAAGDTVYVKNFRRGKSWLPGTVVSGDGSVILQVRLEDGTVVRRHKDHVKPRVVRVPKVEQHFVKMDEGHKLDHNRDILIFEYLVHEQMSLQGTGILVWEIHTCTSQLC